MSVHLCLFLSLALVGCETLSDSARRGAQRGAERATERTAEQAADAAVRQAADAASGAVRGTGGAGLDCATLLPDAEVARVCRVRGVQGDAVAEGPDECSRGYLNADGDVGLVLTVHATRSAVEAQTMVQIEGAAATGGTSRTLADLGDGGVARTLAAPTGGPLGYAEHAVAFSAGASMASLKATQIHEARPALCTLDQMESLARTVAAGLR